MHVYTLPQTEMVLAVDLETRNDLEDEQRICFVII